MEVDVKELYFTHDVARILKEPDVRIAYLIKSGKIPPGKVIKYNHANRRVWQKSEIDSLDNLK